MWPNVFQFMTRRASHCCSPDHWSTVVPFLALRMRRKCLAESMGRSKDVMWTIIICHANSNSIACVSALPECLWMIRDYRNGELRAPLLRHKHIMSSGCFMPSPHDHPEISRVFFVLLANSAAVKLCFVVVALIRANRSCPCNAIGRNRNDASSCCGWYYTQNTQSELKLNK